MKAIFHSLFFSHISFHLKIVESESSLKHLIMLQKFKAILVCVASQSCHIYKVSIDSTQLCPNHVPSKGIFFLVVIQTYSRFVLSLWVLSVHLIYETIIIILMHHQLHLPPSNSYTISFVVSFSIAFSSIPYISNSTSYFVRSSS